jgi:hypothetical protein
MKKLLSVLLATMLMITFSATVLAASVDKHEKSGSASFLINDVTDYAQTFGVKGNSGITRIPIHLDIGNNVSTNLIVTLNPKTSITKASSGILNFTVSGNFYRTSDNEIVSVYGLSGSFTYSGDDTEITGKSTYHNATLQDWSGTSKKSTSKEDLYHISVLTGDYTLYYKGEENNTAQIKIAVSESGMYSVGGDYESYDVN